MIVICNLNMSSPSVTSTGLPQAEPELLQFAGVSGQ